MSTWFVADTHFGHGNIIDYCRRPFRSVGEMDATLIAAWNARVHPADTVYHLGDFMLFGDEAAVQRYRQRLNGKIHLIRGNHDKRSKNLDGVFETVSDLEEIVVSVEGAKQRVVLCHYAMRIWPHSHHGSWHLFGHSHGTLADDPKALSLDVGVDCWDYAPVSVMQVAAKMKKKTWNPVDHHGLNREE